jgi:Protein of unknown function (DUF3592)
MKFEYRSGDNDSPLNNGSGSDYAQAMPRWMARAICFVLLTIGIAILAVATYLYFKQVEFMKTAVRSPAQIMELIEDKGEIGKDDTTYKPILRFIANDEKTYEIKASVGFSRGLQNVGDQVQVIYAPGKPEEADLDNYFSNWISVLLYVMGLVFFGLSGAGLYLTRRSTT